jgi:hypothetical protein
MKTILLRAAFLSQTWTRAGTRRPKRRLNSPIDRDQCARVEICDGCVIRRGGPPRRHRRGLSSFTESSGRGWRFRPARTFLWGPKRQRPRRGGADRDRSLTTCNLPVTGELSTCYRPVPPERQFLCKALKSYGFFRLDPAGKVRFSLFSPATRESGPPAALATARSRRRRDRPDRSRTRSRRKRGRPQSRRSPPACRAGPSAGGQ